MGIVTHLFTEQNGHASPVCASNTDASGTGFPSHGFPHPGQNQQNGRLCLAVPCLIPQQPCISNSFQLHFSSPTGNIMDQLPSASQDCWKNLFCSANHHVTHGMVAKTHKGTVYGNTGATLSNPRSTHSFKTLIEMNKLPYYKLSWNGSGKDASAAEHKSKLVPSKMHWAPLARPSNWQALSIPHTNLEQITLTHDYNDN